MNAKPAQAISGCCGIHASVTQRQLALVSKHLACRVPVATETNVVGDMSWSLPKYHHEIIRANIYESEQVCGQRSQGDVDSCQHRPAAYLHA